MVQVLRDMTYFCSELYFILKILVINLTFTWFVVLSNCISFLYSSIISSWMIQLWDLSCKIKLHPEQGGFANYTKQLLSRWAPFHVIKYSMTNFCWLFAKFCWIVHQLYGHDKFKLSFMLKDDFNLRHWEVASRVILFTTQKK